MLRPWNINIRLNSSSEKAIYLQIADAIIDDIRNGRLSSGTALPGSRQLAELLKVNRNTIVDALEVLLIEGWLVSRERKGTFVAEELPQLNKTRKMAADSTKAIPQPKYRIQFDDGYPDSKVAPVNELARAYRQIFNRKAKWQMMGYGDPLGDHGFREEIARMLNHQRNMHITEADVCITRGSQMAMYLAAQCLVKPGDYVMIEDPGYKPAWLALEKAGAKLLPVSVDEDGLAIEDVIKHLKTKKVRALYTTPHRQYPTTVTLSLQRRLQLISLSNEYGFTIIEDDYDNEFHFGYRPVHPLSSFAELENYIYIGTLSKVVAPSLRIGYLVTKNQGLIRTIADLRKLIDVQGDTIMEQAVLELIRDGTIRRHIRKASNYYKEKRDAVAQMLTKQLSGKANLQVPEGGLAFWIIPLKKTDWSGVQQKLSAQGILISTPENYSFKKSCNGLRIGYGALTEQQLKEGVAALARLL
ncbi:MAG: PLP-dependent aminotransferase family protein [Flavitalea sp.]